MFVIILFFGLIVGVGVALCAYNIYTYFVLLEEFGNKTPSETFMEEYYKVKKERMHHANEY